MQKESRLAVCRFLRSLQDHQKPISNLLSFQSRLAVRHMKCQWKANFHLALEMAGMALCNATIVSADQGHPDHSLGMLAQKECSSNLQSLVPFGPSLLCVKTSRQEKKKKTQTARIEASTQNTRTAAHKGPLHMAAVELFGLALCFPVSFLIVAMPKLNKNSHDSRSQQDLTSSAWSKAAFQTDTRKRSFSDTLAEWLRRRPAKPMGSPCVGSNPTGVVSRCSFRNQE